MKWYVRRTLYSIVAWFLAISVTFLVIRISPGDPATLLFASLRMQGYSIEAARRMVMVYLGYVPEEPIHLSLGKFLVNIFRGDLGISVYWRRPVAQLIGSLLPWSVFFAAWSILWTFVVGVSVGLIMAYYRHKSIVNNTLRIILSIFRAIPAWLLAVILHLYLAIAYNVFPVGGAYPKGIEPGFSITFVTAVLWHYTLPTIIFVLTSFPGWALGMAAMAISVMHDDYVEYAKLRGVPGRRILTAYVARNSILPIYTQIAPTLAAIIVGAVWIESRFVLPGIGSLLATAISLRDYSLMMGCYIVVVTAIVFGNLLTDLTYGFIDPRARIGEEV